MWRVREMHPAIWQPEHLNEFGMVSGWRCAQRWGDGERCQTRVWEQSSVSGCMRLYRQATGPDGV